MKNRSWLNLQFQCLKAANTKGITFIRVSRPATDVFYENDEIFEVGKAKVVVKSDNDAVLVIAAGITLDQV